MSGRRPSWAPDVRKESFLAEIGPAAGRLARRVRVTVVGIVTVGLLTACEWAGGSVCTLIGAESGVLFAEIGGVLPPAPTPGTGRSDEPAYEVVACARGECVRWQGTRADQPWLQVTLGDLREPISVNARLTVTAADSREVIFDAVTSVDLQIYQPNGPECEPTVFQGRVRPTNDGRLVPVADPPQ